MSDKPRVPLRKKPSQERSRSMVDAILTGAARILAKARSETPLSPPEEGRTAPMTTNKVAEVAGVSIGSLYQYFPGKKAILEALLERRLRDTYDALLARIDRDNAASLDDAVSALVDAFVDMKLDHASVDAGLVEEALRQGLTGEAFSLDEEYVDRFAGVIDRWKPIVRDDLPSDVAAYVLFQGLRAVMVIGSFQRPRLVGDPRLRAELKRLVLAWTRAT